MTNKNPYVQEEKLTSNQITRGVSNHTPHSNNHPINPLSTNARKSDNDVIHTTTTVDATQ